MYENRTIEGRKKRDILGSYIAHHRDTYKLYMGKKTFHEKAANRETFHPAFLHSKLLDLTSFGQFE